MINKDLQKKLAALEQWFAGKESALVAYSGGIDSTLLLKIATNVLGPSRALGVTSKSESLADEALKNAKQVAEQHGFNHEVIFYSELAIPNYAENPVNRCFYCKNELYTRLIEIAKKRGIAVVVEGSNADDLDDHRPGMHAAHGLLVASPLQETGMTKDDVRRLAREFELPNWDLPSAPCLSSRLPYGHQITREKLDQVAAGEQYLREQGFSQVRLRNFGKTARVELLPEEMHRLFLEIGLREQLIDYIKSLGFIYITLDLQGFRSGAMNEMLGVESAHNE